MGQCLLNCYRKCMESADSVAQSQLPFTIKTVDGNHTLCGCSMEDYLWLSTLYKAIGSVKVLCESSCLVLQLLFPYQLERIPSVLHNTVLYSYLWNSASFQAIKMTSLACRRWSSAVCLHTGALDLSTHYGMAACADMATIDTGAIQ